MIKSFHAYVTLVSPLAMFQSGRVVVYSVHYRVLYNIVYPSFIVVVWVEVGRASLGLKRVRATED